LNFKVFGPWGHRVEFFFEITGELGFGTGLFAAGLQNEST
jgi:hypothetical protein